MQNSRCAAITQIASYPMDIKYKKWMLKLLKWWGPIFLGTHWIVDTNTCCLTKSQNAALPMAGTAEKDCNTAVQESPHCLQSIQKTQQQHSCVLTAAISNDSRLSEAADFLTIAYRQEFMCKHQHVKATPESKNVSDPDELSCHRNTSHFLSDGLYSQEQQSHLLFASLSIPHRLKQCGLLPFLITTSFDESQNNQHIFPFIKWWNQLHYLM